MSEIYQKSTTAGNEKCVILDYREGLRMPFKINDWNHAKVAVVWSWTQSGPNDAFAYDGFYDALMTINNDNDRMYFGLKKYNTLFPGAPTQDYFLGATSYGPRSSFQMPHPFFFPGTNHGDNINIGVFHKDGTMEGSQGNALLQGPGRDQYTTTANFAFLLGMDIEILNKGQSNQQVAFKWFKEIITNTSKANLDSRLAAATYTDAGTLDFALDGVPYDLPDTFFMYSPFGDIRLRVFALNFNIIS